MPTIERLEALEILDSRGRPTVQTTCYLASGATATAQVPSGASTGLSEAVELRDGDAQRYRGLGCRRAVAHVTRDISNAVRGKTYDDQNVFDSALIELDGTNNKSRLGANAILSVSLSFARATACERKVPFFQHLADMCDRPLVAMPRMTINLFSGGKHAGGQVPIQDVLIVPVSATTIADALATSCAVYQAAADHVEQTYAMRRLTADEGGLAPPFASIDAMFNDALMAIEKAGFQPGRDIALAVDVASSHFYQGDVYDLGSERLDAHGMIDQLERWVDHYPIVSIEDGLAEDDWEHWPMLRERLVGRSLTLGDDLLCTNPERIRRAIDVGACDALLLKVNQIGTLTEAAEALQLARSADWHVTISARSGETEDDWLSDLAVGWSGDHIKVGSVTQSERLSKYNRLLAIEAKTKLPVR